MSSKINDPINLNKFNTKTNEKSNFGKRKRPLLTNSNPFVNMGSPSDEVEIHIKKNISKNESDSSSNIKNSALEDTVKKRKIHHPKGSCWGCMHGNIEVDAKDHPAQYGLWNMFANQYGSINNDELAKNMYEYFEEFIRQPSIENGEHCEKWPEIMIKEHFLNHMKEPKVIVVEQMRNMQNIVDIMMDNCIKEKPNGDILFDHKVLDKISKFNKDIRDLLNYVPEKCLGFNKNLNMK